MSILLTKIRSRFSDSSGLTLIELMIAMFVFAIGMLAVTAMCLISIQGNSMVDRMTQANLLAQSRMEELLSVRDMDILDILDDPGGVNIDGVGNAGTSYLRTVDVALDAANPDVRWITVNVSWGDTKGTHQFELKSLARAR